MSNREELTRQAEKCLRQGRVEDAIALYQELATLTPIDWGIVKQLADLFERAGQREAASRQFCRWADHLAVEGFHSKAAALYKKVLKLEPSDEHALWQLGEVSLELKLRADARVAFQRVLELRQRRGDTAGVEGARQRLATLDAAAPAPVRVPLGGAPWTTMAAGEAPEAPIVDADPQTSRPSVVVAAPSAPAAAVNAVPAPPEERLLPPAETPAQRVARLRSEAEEAERRQGDDAETRWHSVLDAEPQDVATRLRLVQRAMDRLDFEAAHRLALPLDASETTALVLLVELAWRRGHPDAVRRLVAARVHAGASPGHILAPLDALGGRLPDAARAALAAAVAAWKAAGQPGHAVAALELADRRGLLDIASYLQWVEICVDAGVAGLSRAQGALARAYVSAGRVADARAVAEDLFVREGGTEPYRALLLDVLDRLGEANPHRVLVDLLTPPSEAVDEPPALSSSVIDEVVDLDLDLAVTPPAEALAAASADRLPEPPAGTRSVALVDEESLGGPPAADAPMPREHLMAAPRLPDMLVAPAVTPANPSTMTSSSFDWAFLLGRDVDESWSDGPAVDVMSVTDVAAVTDVATPAPVAAARVPVEAIEHDKASVVAEAVAPPDAAADKVEPVAPEASPREVEAIGVTEPEMLVGPAAPSPLQPAEAVEAVEPPALANALQDSEPLGAPEHDPYEVRTPVDPVLARIAAAQPLMAAPSEVLPPTFSVPSSWFGETPAGQTAARRQRHPEDAYLFEDDEQTQSRWSRPLPPPSQPVVGTGVAPVGPPAPESHDESLGMSGSSGLVGMTSALDESLPADTAPDERFEGLENEAVDGDPTADEVPGPVPEDIEEEVDLTQLLEELRQFDTVLPDPPARPVLSGSADEASRLLAVLEPSTQDDPAPRRSLSDLLTPPPPLDESHLAAPAPAVAPDATTQLDAVFADLQRHTDDRLVAEQQLAAGRVFLAAGLVSEAARAFERASQAPRSRFAAAQALAELHRSRGQLPEAVSWYEQAAAAPVPDADVKRPVLYDLAESLEALGETDRALGVLLDLLSQVEDYRDARARLDRLLRVDAGG